MPAKIRVFVSSTMEDLANEREAVVEAVRSLNFEPVNAEGTLPNGGTSFDVLESAIRSSHVCILLLGDRYGWIPTTGYGAGQGKSVTHLEIDVARDQGVPILPFFKELKYGADSVSEDAKRRDQFRKEIGDWRDGFFRGQFRLASDLRTKAGQALLDVLVTPFLRSLVQAQAARSSVAPASPPEAPAFTTPPASGAPPDILFAGAGLSLSAGYPSANALAGALGQSLGLEPEMLARHSLAQLFEAAEQLLGRAKSVQIVASLLDPPLPVEPTSAHMAAVQRFKVILTTNYDQLFERACSMLKIAYQVRTPNEESPNDAGARVTIFKIDGSIERPDTLVLTPADAQRARADGTFWSDLEATLSTSRPIVIGHSLRDTNSRALMERREKSIRGVYVAPVLDQIDRRLLLTQLNLESVENSASEYLWAPPT